MARARRSCRLVVAGCCLAMLACGLFAGGAAAGDTPGLLDFDPQETDAQPGETVTVDATLRSDGGYSGEGVASIEQTIAYDPEVLSVVDVERGPWLEQGNDTEIVVTTDVDEEAGRLTVEQAREPVAGGATGEGTTLTVTFEVAEDAPPADAVLQYADVEVMLETGYPHGTVDREGLVRIDGGGDERVPLAEDDDGESPGVTTPANTATEPTGGDSGSGDGGTDGDPDDSGDDGDDPAEDQVGFGAGAGLVALVAAVLLGRRMARSTAECQK